MEHLKILLVSEEKKVREPLKKYFSEWGMKTLEFNKPPEISTVKSLNPQLVFMEKKYFGNCSFLSENTSHPFENAQKPGIVIVLEPADKMPLMNELGENSILQIPYSRTTLFDTVRQALCHSHTESSLGTVLVKLDMIYDILLKSRNSSELWANKTTFGMDELMTAKNGQILDNKEGIIPKSKSLILSLLKDAKNNRELGQYQEQLHLLEQYISELELGHEDYDPAPVSDLLKTHPLSRKELKIFSLITRGMTTEEIADRLYISPETVKSHRRNIRKKLSLVGNKVSLADFINHLNGNDHSAPVEYDA